MINIFRKYFSPTFQSIQAIIFQYHSTLIWCLTTRCLRIFVVEVVDEKMVLQWLHIVVSSVFFMKCFQTSERPLERRVFLVTGERPCGKYQSSRPRSWASPPLSSCISRSRVICVSWFKIIKKFRFVSQPYRIYSPDSFNMIITSQFGALVRGVATCFQLNCGQQKLSSPEGKDCTWPWSSPYSSWNASIPPSVHAESTNPASIDPGWYVYHDLK